MTNNPSDQQHLSLEAIYASALHDVADRRRTPLEREAAARLLTFVLHEREVSEAVAADVLAAAQRSFDLPTAVLTLMLGLRDTVSDHARVAASAIRLANLALEARHGEAFLVLVGFLIGLGSWGGDIPASWRAAFARAHGDRLLRDRISRTSEAYSRRFGRSFFAGSRFIHDNAKTGGGA